MADSCQVKCVKQSSPNQERVNILEEAFQTLVEYEFEPSWVTEEECLSAKERENSLYVFHSFCSPAFEHLKNLACRIVGPSCLLTCLQNEMPLPKVKMPLISLAMRGLNINCTSIDRETRMEIENKVRMMGGDVAKPFTADVTHLVSAEVGSNKYKVAANLRKPIVLPDWVYYCWDTSATHQMNADDEMLLKRFRCPVFKGLTICVSQLDNAMRLKVKDMIEKEGGKYSGDMKINECTHLVLLKAAGQKYEFAKKWQIHTVSLPWLYDSMDKGYCLDEVNYVIPGQLEPPRDSQKTSTPVKDATAAARMSTLPDVSTIADVSYCQINETGQQTTMSHQSMLQHAATGVNETHMAADQSTFARQASAQDCVDLVNIDDVTGDMFLDGCKVYLSGFTGPKLEKVKKLINAGGGTLYKELTDSLTHVVMNGKIQVDIKQMIDGNFRPHVVSADWLVQCSKEGVVVDPQPFVVHEFTSHFDPLTPVSKSKLTGKSDRVPEKPKAGDSSKEVSHSDARVLDDVMSQYLPQPPATIGDSTLMQALDRQDTAAEASTMKHGDVSVAALEQQQQSENDQLVFSKKSFALFGFDEGNDFEQLKVLIVESGGTVVDKGSRMVPNFGVVPVTGYIVDGTVEEIVTNCWLQMCLEAEQFLPFDSNVLFRPLDVNIEAMPLNNCVISISQFSGTERDCLTHLAEILGAVCQEYFVRKARKGLSASTHLILRSPEGQKYTAAQKWQIPAVNKQWLIDCAQTGIRLSEENYLVKEESTVAAVTPATEASAAVGGDKTSLRSEHEITNENMPGEADDKASEQINTSGKENKAEAEIIAVKTIANVDQSLVTPENNRVKALKEASSKTNEGKTAELDGSWRVSPSVFLNPNVLFIPKFDTKDLYIPTPEDAKTRKRSSVDSLSELSELYAQKLDEAAQYMENLPLDAAIHHTPLSQKIETPQRKPPPVLPGVIIAVSKKLASRQTEINNIAASLGADYRWVYDATCTHFVYQGKSTDNNKELRRVKADRKMIVSPEWLKVCQEKQSKVPEEDYPYTFNPKMSLPIAMPSTQKQGSRQSVRRSSKRQEVVDEDDYVPPAKKPTFLDDKKASDFTIAVRTTRSMSDKSGSDTDAGPKKSKTTKGKQMEAAVEQVDDHTTGDKAGVSNSNKNDKDENVNDAAILLNAKLDSLLNSTGSSTKKRAKKTMKLTSRSTPTSSAGATQASRPSSRQRHSSKKMANQSQSQSVPVVWDDSVGNAERAEMVWNRSQESQNDDASDANHNSQEGCKLLSSSLHERVQTDEKDEDKEPQFTQTPEAPSIAFPLPKPNAAQTIEISAPPTVQHRKFLLSGLANQERDEYGGLIEQLGGEVSTSQYFDLECTHLVIGNPTRNEKYLSCLAAGKWILHKSYLEASRTQQCFVLEEEHEWGTEVTLTLCEGEMCRNLAKAARRWRESGGKAFEGWKVVIMDRIREGSFRRLIEAGGGVVVATRPPFEDLADVTHAFIDINKIKIDEDVMSSLHKCGALCLKPEYLSSYLIEDPLPDPTDYLVQNTADETEAATSKRRKVGTTPKRRRR